MSHTQCQPDGCVPQPPAGAGSRLAGRVALITGASRGIGAAVAKCFAAEGAQVVLVARTVGGLEAVDDSIRAAGGLPATLVPLDLTEHARIDELGPALYQRFGRLDVLVGNAGVVGVIGPVAQSDPKYWERAFALNAVANYRLIRNLDPLLRASEAGRAIFVTDGAARAGDAYWGAYAASKAALEAIVRAYAAETLQTRLRVNLIDPGVVRTALREKAFPGLDPQSMPAPETVVEPFVALAEAACTQHGALVVAAS